jgi:flagellin-like hook-associated protein FlgL
VSSASLRQARDQAQHIAGQLAQLGDARKALGSVQQFVEQLRDVAVVSLVRTLAPSGRVALQRQLDSTLGDIDDLARSTPLDGKSTGLAIAMPVGSTDSSRSSASFPAIGTAALGIADLGVRSPDEAFGTMRLLDRALARLGATAASLDGATARFEHELSQLTSPARTANGGAALTSTPAAMSAAMRTSDQLRSRPQNATVAQAAPSVAQSRSLLR